MHPHTLDEGIRRREDAVPLSLHWVCARALRWCVAWLLCWMAVITPSFGADPALTPAERAWVQQNPVIKLAVPGQQPPYHAVDPKSGEPIGYAVELMSVVSERVGLRVVYQPHASLESAHQAVLSGASDGLLMQPMGKASGSSPLLQTRPMLTTQVVWAVRRDVPDISPTANFGGYRVAVEAGSDADLLLATRFPSAKAQRHPNAQVALLAVSTGDADLFLGDARVAVHWIESLLLANVQVRGGLGPGLGAYGPALRSNLTVLHSVLDKGLASITQAERAAVAQRWLPPDSGLHAQASGASLTEAERAWVDAHGRIRVGYDASFAPITLQTDLSELRGLGADFVRLAAQKVGISIESEIGGSFAQIYAGGIEGDIDVIVGAARTSARRQHYDFVGPFMRVPTGIVTASQGGMLITRLEELGRNRLALLDQHFLIPQLRNRYPGLQLLTFSSQDLVLAAVADGKADAAIGNLKVINQLIDSRYTGRVRVTGTVPNADSELYFAVRRDLPELTRVLRKGLDAIAPEEARNIESHWLTVERPTGVPWSHVLQIGVVLLAVMVWLGIWAYLLSRGNRRLHAAKQLEGEARALAEATTQSRGRFLGYLSHELRGTLGAIAAGASMVRNEPSAVQRSRMLDAIQASAQGFQSLLETTLQYEQRLDRPIELNPEAVDLRAQWPQLIAPFELSAQAKGLALRTALELGDAEQVWVQIDLSRWRQVMNNLVGNAIKFTSLGEVSVSARLGAEAGRQCLILEVADSGPGLSEDDLGSLFQPYAQGAQGQRKRQGAGLGLAIARQIVDAMGGQLSAGRAVSGGALFSARVPAPAAPRVDAPAPAPTLADSVHHP